MQRNITISNSNLNYLNFLDGIINSDADGTTIYLI
jgi:hypothetical protein